jgi:hypothetical protein
VTAVAAWMDVLGLDPDVLESGYVLVDFAFLFVAVRLM